jgi:hypothetical protein
MYDAFRLAAAGGRQMLRFQDLRPQINPFRDVGLISALDLGVTFEA